MTNRAILIAALLAGVPALAASPPDRMNYQGVLRDSAGAPLDGSYDMAFVFFDSEVLGNEITFDVHWSSLGGPVVVTGGLFNVALGSGVMGDGAGPGSYATLGDMFRDYPDVWLEIEVNGETLSPRIRVASAAYALNSRSLGGKAASDFLDTSSTTQTKAGALSINASAPGPPHLALGGGNWDTTASDGDLKVGDDTYRFRLGVATGGGGAGDVRLNAVGGTNRMMLGGGTGADLTLWNGKVGIANPEPAFPLDVVGDTWMRGNAVVQGSLSLLGDFMNFNHAGAFFTGSETSVHIYGGEASSDSLFLHANTLFDSAGISVFGDAYFQLRSGDGRFFFRNQQSATTTAELAPDGAFRVTGDFQSNGDELYFLTHGSRVTASASGVTVASGFEGGDDLLLRAGNSSGNGAINVFGDSELQLRSGSGLFTFLNDAGAGSVETGRLDTFGNLQIDGELRFGPGSSELREVGALRDVQIGRSHTSSWFEVLNFEGQAQMRIENGDEAPANFDGPVNANGIDYAEAFQVADPTLEPGDVVVLALASPGFVERSAGEYAPGLVGVVSAKPGFVTGNSFDAEDSADVALAAARAQATRAGDHERAREISIQLGALKAERQRPVALLGRVPVKVDGAYGAIRPGDVLTSSPTPGHAMALEQPGPAIGIALEGWTSPDRGSILMFIDPGWSGGVREKIPAAELRVAVEDRPAGAAETSPAKLPLGGGFRAMAPAIAETFLASSPVEVGDVVAIDPDGAAGVVPAREPGDPAVIGVATSGPGVLLGAADSGRTAVALVGTSPCKVDAGYGAIRPGDLLMTSATPGHAMRAVDAPPGAVFAKALESLEFGTGTIRVLLWAR